MLRRLPLFAAFLLALSLGCAGSDAQSDQTTIELDQGDPGEGESGDDERTHESSGIQGAAMGRAVPFAG